MSISPPSAPHPIRHTFGDELELQAVRLVREQHIAAVQVCKGFNISRSTLHRRLLQYEAGRDGRSGPGTPITAGQRRIRKLERENLQLRQELEILKKASAFFARGTCMIQAPIHRRGEKAYFKAPVTRLRTLLGASRASVYAAAARGPARRVLMPVGAVMALAAFVLHCRPKGSPLAATGCAG